MAKTPIVKVTFVGDSTSAQKSVKDLAGAATSAEVKVEGFGKSFLALGAGFGVGAAAASKATEVFFDGAAAIKDYTLSVDQSEKRILGFTKSQEQLAAAQALANKEQKAGRATYDATLESLASLMPLAAKYNANLEDVLHTTELLAAIDPEQGFQGAKIALQEALSGDFTSLARRFELPRSAIQKLKDEGVPNLQIVQKVLADLGFDQNYLDTANTSTAKSMEILKGQLVQIGAEITKGFFNDLAAGVKDTADQLNNAESGLRKLGDLFGEIEEKFNGLAGNIQGAGNNIGESIIKGLAAIPNTRGADDPVEKWLQEQIKRYERSGEEIAATARKSSEKGTAAAVSGAAPSPAQKTQVEGYGRDILLSLVKGLDSGQGDALDKIGAVFADLFKGADGKADAGKLTEANVALAQALKETANGGQLTSETMYALSAAYGLQTPLVYKLVEAYQAQAQAQTGIAAANTKVAAANAALSVVNAQATGETKQLEAALTSAQQAAAAHAQETADALEPLTAALAGMRAAAEAAGLQNSAAIAGLTKDLEGLQDQANANAADFQRQIASAQADYEQAQNRRQQLQGAMNAALHGEVEEWLRINEITDDSIRKIAEKWQKEIDGQRRAKEGADQAVTKLSREGNRDERDSLLKIAELRKNNQMAEANREQAALDKRRQQRAKEMEIARAQAAVAGDEYDEKAEALAKEGKKVDEAASKEEREAKKRVDEVTAQAAAQKAADDAAIKAKQDQIKAVQDAGRAEQERYAAQQRGIQAEIDKVNEAAKVQAAKDKKTIDDAQTILADRKTFWDQEIIKAGENLTQRQNEATAAANIAADSKTSYEWLERITKLDFQNVLDAAKAAKEMANQPPAPPSTQNGTGLAPAPQNTPGQTEGQIGPPGAAPGAGTSNLPPLYAGAPGATPPPGYHSEVDNAGNFWFVADGYSLLNYGKQQGPGRTGQGNGDSTSMTSASAGGPSFLRAAGVGGGALPASAPAADGAWTIQINAPNLRDLGNKQDQREFAALMRRTWSEARRGGLDPGKVDQG